MIETMDQECLAEWKPQPTVCEDFSCQASISVSISTQDSYSQTIVPEVKTAVTMDTQV